MKRILTLLLLLFLYSSLSAQNPETRLHGIQACLLYENLRLEEEKTDLFEYPFELFTKKTQGLECNFWINTFNKYEPGCICIFRENLTLEERTLIYDAIGAVEKVSKLPGKRLSKKSLDTMDFVKETDGNEKKSSDYFFSVFEEFYD